ncbi:MAG TPA: 50S ribosomal protein L10 [bacterium]|nr:50S ribosomal protein L10 [bacterium]
MTHPRPEKVAEVQGLEQQLRGSAVVILTDYRGLTVSEIGSLRSKLREAALEYRVAKNTLLSRAAEQAGLTGLAPYLVGPTAVVFGRDDPGAPARILQEFIRQYRKLEIKGGVVEGQAVGPDGVQALATLPTKRELIAKLLGTMQMPLRSLLTVLTGPPRGLVTALDAIRKQREAAGPSQEAGSEAATVVSAPETVPAEGTDGVPAEGTGGAPGTVH